MEEHEPLLGAAAVVDGPDAQDGRPDADTVSIESNSVRRRLTASHLVITHPPTYSSTKSLLIMHA